MTRTTDYGNTYRINEETGLIEAEILESGKEIRINMKNWKDLRYYITRNGQQIGWISKDLTEGKGQRSSTNQFYIDQMIEALGQ